MQPNGCRSCRWVEEKTTESGDQEVELMVFVVSPRGTMAGVDHGRRKKYYAEVREEEMVVV